jgi:hypothetical protein
MKQLAIQAENISSKAVPTWRSRTGTLTHDLNRFE